MMYVEDELWVYTDVAKKNGANEIRLYRLKKLMRFIIFVVANIEGYAKQ